MTLSLAAIAIYTLIFAIVVPYAVHETGKNQPSIGAAHLLLANQGHMLHARRRHFEVEHATSSRGNGQHRF
ncbi:MAG: hypothetical protein ACYDHP_06125 [Ferrimicrobium sp.]